jgi:small GTP-binding protein
VVRVARVHPETIAAELGITPGTQLVRVNGRELADFLDWEFLTADEELVIDAVQPDGEAVVYEVERPEGEPFGLELEPPTVRRCANRCEFCFIEGLPKGLRKPLYMRDDDYRLSFAYGNFATLSNLKDRDFARIIEYRLSPLYVSVHATPHEARKRLLNNPRVPNIVEQLTRLKAGGIQFHGQMVVVPGLNDGEVLEQSLQDLWDLGDAVLSVALVPVGVTQFSHLYTGRPMDVANADACPRRGRAVGGARAVRARRALGVRLGRAVPARRTRAARPRALRRLPPDRERHRRRDGAAHAGRGRRRGAPAARRAADRHRHRDLHGPLMPELLDRLAAHTGARFELISVENSLFGPTTTTAGLLVGATSAAPSTGARTWTSRSSRPSASTRTGCSSTTRGSWTCARRCPCPSTRRTTSSTCFRSKRSPLLPWPAEGPRMSLPVVALVGRPNVGKSALFNRLVGEHSAIVSDEAGTTRDRHFGRVEWDRRAFWLVDTGGLADDQNVPMNVEIRKQVRQAIEEADLLALVVDARTGVHPSDAKIVDLLRDSGKPFVLVANKVDHPDSTDYYEFYRLGAGDPVPVSATNGKQSGDLLDVINSRLPATDEQLPEALRVAVIGRPNVGKSSFVNKLLGEDRLVVSDVAGTTRDAIDTPYKYHGRDLVFVDTAGLRPPEQGGRRRGVLLVAPLAPSDRGCRHLRAHGRRHARRREPGPEDRDARVGERARADPRG